MSTAPRSLNSVELSNSYTNAGSSDKLRNQGSSNGKIAPWVWILAICSVVAIGISMYLTWASFTSSKIAGCGGGSVFDCSHVTNSKWSTWMGVPVSLLAIGSYLSLATALVLAVFQTAPQIKRFAWTAVTMFALSAGMAAVWFTGIQVFVLEHFCSYCLAAHACGIIAAVIAVWKIPQSKSILKFAGPVATVGIAVLIVGQVYQSEPEKFRIETFETSPTTINALDAPFAAPTENSGDGADGAVFEAPVVSVEESEATSFLVRLFSAERVVAMVRPAVAMMAFTSPLQNGQATTNQSKPKTAKSKTAKSKTAKSETKARRTVGINGGTIKLNVDQWPLSGPVDAKHVFVEMLDYNCPNCRKTHKAVLGAKKILNDDVSVMILPIPLNTACNRAVTTTDAKFIESCDIAKLAIAVWRVDAVKFRQFHDAMFASEPALTYAQAKELANSMVDSAKLDAELASGVPGKFISSMVQLYEKSGKGGVPKLMFPGTSIVGEFSSADSLAEVIRQQTK